MRNSVTANQYHTPKSISGLHVTQWDKTEKGATGTEEDGAHGREGKPEVLEVARADGDADPVLGCRLRRGAGQGPRAGLHKLWYPGIRDMSTWSKFGAHGEHGDVFLFSNLGAL